MTLLFISDIHINLSKNTKWEITRINKLFDILSKETYDALILGGDIFDNAKPTLQEIRIFYKNIQKIDKPIYIIAGNHENIEKYKTTFDYLPEVNFKYFRNEAISLEKIDLYFVSHTYKDQLTDLRLQLKNKKNILFSHLRCNVPPYIKEEYDIKFLSNTFDLVILGDIHQPLELFNNVHYPGQPFSSKYTPNVEHQYFLIDTDTLEITKKELNLPNKILLNLTLKQAKDYIYSPENLYKVKITGFIDELKEFKNTKNVIFEKTIKTSITETEAFTLVDNKIDTVELLKKTTKDMYKLSDSVMQRGEQLLEIITKDIA